MEKSFDTAPFFVGGSGMFVQYHDILKPTYLYSVFRMIITKENYGLPTSIIEDFSILSLLEWYKNRRYKNPLQQLDWKHQIPKEDMDNLLSMILQDTSIYRLAPTLNFGRMIQVYISQHMVFPWIIYSEEYEEGIEKDCKNIFNGIKYKYVYGPLKEAIMKCDQNYTYIFSDIELLNLAAEILHGTYSILLLARDYRYNYIDNFKTMKYDLQEVATKHPFLRIETITAMDVGLMQDSFDNVLIR